VCIYERTRGSAAGLLTYSMDSEEEDDDIYVPSSDEENGAAVNQIVVISSSEEEDDDMQAEPEGRMEQGAEEDAAAVNQIVVLSSSEEEDDDMQAEPEGRMEQGAEGDAEMQAGWGEEMTVEGESSGAPTRVKATRKTGEIGRTERPGGGGKEPASLGAAVVPRSSITKETRMEWSRGNYSDEDLETEETQEAGEMLRRRQMHKELKNKRFMWTINENSSVASECIDGNRTALDMIVRNINGKEGPIQFADLNTPVHGYGSEEHTFLEWACINGHSEKFVQRLLDYGAKITPDCLLLAEFDEATRMYNRLDPPIRRLLLKTDAGQTLIRSEYWHNKLRKFAELDVEQSSQFDLAMALIYVHDYDSAIILLRTVEHDRSRPFLHAAAYYAGDEQDGVFSEVETVMTSVNAVMLSWAKRPPEVSVVPNPLTLTLRQLFGMCVPPRKPGYPPGAHFCESVLLAACLADRITLWPLETLLTPFDWALEKPATESRTTLMLGIQTILHGGLPQGSVLSGLVIRNQHARVALQFPKRGPVWGTLRRRGGSGKIDLVRTEYQITPTLRLLKPGAEFTERMQPDGTAMQNFTPDGRSHEIDSWLFTPADGCTERPDFDDVITPVGVTNQIRNIFRNWRSGKCVLRLEIHKHIVDISIDESTMNGLIGALYPYQHLACLGVTKLWYDGEDSLIFNPPRRQHKKPTTYPVFDEAEFQKEVYEHAMVVYVRPKHPRYPYAARCSDHLNWTTGGPGGGLITNCENVYGFVTAAHLWENVRDEKLVKAIRNGKRAKGRGTLCARVIVFRVPETSGRSGEDKEVDQSVGEHLLPTASRSASSTPSSSDGETASTAFTSASTSAPSRRRKNQGGVISSSSEDEAAEDGGEAADSPAAPLAAAARCSAVKKNGKQCRQTGTQSGGDLTDRGQGLLCSYHIGTRPYPSVANKAAEDEFDMDESAEVDRPEGETSSSSREDEGGTSSREDEDKAENNFDESDSDDDF
jgi:hypothetical protein